jgi:hypothetical protein
MTSTMTYTTEMVFCHPGQPVVVRRSANLRTSTESPTRSQHVFCKPWCRDEVNKHGGTCMLGTTCTSQHDTIVATLIAHVINHDERL